MTELWVQRTGARRYTGHNSRGAQVLVGSEDVDGVFTPGELLKIALAACSGMATDRPLAHRFGDDYAATVQVSGAADRDQECYPLLEETLEVDLSSLTETELARLLVVVNRSVEQTCTVGRTLKSGTTIDFEIADARPRSALTDRPQSDVRLTIWVHGHVQGVGFRWWARARALELGLTGYAGNRADGRVLVVAQGPKPACERLLSLVSGGPTPGRVDKVVVDWAEGGAALGEGFSGFSER